MRPPRKHHYLPEWYLSRWKRPFIGEEVIWEFARVGPQQKLQSRYRHPGATGYAVNLYNIPNLPPDEIAQIETKLLQVIDDRGAKAVALAESNVAAGPEDKEGLVKFTLSLLHRTPERIDYIQRRLTNELAEHPAFENGDAAIFREGALRTFVSLIQSQRMIDRMMQLQVFVMKLGDDAHDLLTSDSPLMMSNGLAHREAFIILPTGPRTLIMLAEDPDLPAHMVGHQSKVLSKAMNDAVTVQAKKLVFGSDQKQTRFIDNRLNRPNKHLVDAVDPVTGLVKWKL
jgi:Protein of unknown function (DUF4238)